MAELVIESEAVPAEQFDDAARLGQGLLGQRSSFACRQRFLRESHQGKLREAYARPRALDLVRAVGVDSRGEVRRRPEVRVERSTANDVERQHLTEKPMEVGLATREFRGRTQESLRDAPVFRSGLVDPAQELVEQLAPP